jgi:hypothetical protein
MYEVVKRGERVELGEWRRGERKTAEVERMLSQLDCLTRLSRFEKEVDTKLGDLSQRLERLEKGAAASERFPHRVGAPAS